MDLNQRLSLASLFSDRSRVRLFALLDDRDASVAELVAITELSQSRVSTHLGKLKDAGLVEVRREGASRRYRRAERPPKAALTIYEALAADLDPQVRADKQRRDAQKKPWPESIAGAMGKHYSPGRTFEALAQSFLALVELGDTLDIGCGDGTIAEMIAPRATRYTGVDQSEALIATARSRKLEVAFDVADMHALPYDDESFDAVLMLHVLAYAKKPNTALREAARVLAPGGRLIVAALKKHGHQSVTERYGHENAGQDPRSLRRVLTRQGLTVTQCAVTTKERKAPRFESLTVVATR